MFKDNQIQILKSQLDSNRIKTRDKGNISLSYIEGHDAIQTANEIFGFGNWGYTISKLEQVSQEQNHNQNNVISYKAIVQVLVQSVDHLQDICRQDVGFGTGVAKTLADAHEGAAKEAVTDALKRALRSFGNQFGNSLYSKDKNYNSNNLNYQSKNQEYKQEYKHQGDFNQLTNLGLSVIQQGDNLVIVGNNIFANKDIIKAHGFRWDGINKSWYMQLRQAS